MTDELAALLAHARALVGVELGELADQLGLPAPAAGPDPNVRRAGPDRSSNANWGWKPRAPAAPTSRRWDWN